MSDKLPANLLDRLRKLCGMLGSAHDGERAAAALKADQLLRDSGLTWRDVIRLPGSSTAGARKPGRRRRKSDLPDRSCT